jgi:hypothetical protein
MGSQERHGFQPDPRTRALYQQADRVKVAGVSGRHASLNGLDAPLRSMALMTQENGLAIDRTILEGLNFPYFMWLLVQCPDLPAGTREPGVEDGHYWCALAWHAAAAAHRCCCVCKASLRRGVHGPRNTSRQLHTDHQPAL